MQQTRQAANGSAVSNHRDSSSNTSMNKSRRGRSHRKSRKQSQEGAQAYSIERKANAICYTELYNRSIDEPPPIPKPNVITLQKELVNKSNQKIFDLANCAEDDARDSFSNERIDSLSEFN